MATKKEQARAELMKLPLVTTSLVDTGIGSRWSKSIECCRVNSEIYMKPTWGMFDSTKVTKYIKSGDFTEREALPLRTGSGPFTWMLQVKAVSRLRDVLVKEVRNDSERAVFGQKIDKLLAYSGELEDLTLSDEQISEAHQHVGNRNRLLQESKQEQNDRIASVVGRADGEPLDKYGYELSNGTLKKLERAGITTVEKLLAWSRLDLLKIGGFGRKSLTEVDDMMEAHGWQFGKGNPSDNDTDEKPLTVTLTHKPGDMITWREWTKADGFGKEHQTKVEEVTLNVYWDETRQQYSQTEKYSTSMIADGKRVSVMVDLMSENVLIGCLDVLDMQSL